MELPPVDDELLLPDELLLGLFEDDEFVVVLLLLDEELLPDFVDFLVVVVVLIWVVLVSTLEVTVLASVGLVDVSVNFVVDSIEVETLLVVVVVVTESILSALLQADNVVIANTIIKMNTEYRFTLNSSIILMISEISLYNNIILAWMLNFNIILVNNH